MKRQFRVWAMVFVLLIALPLTGWAAYIGGELNADLVYEWDQDEEDLLQASIPTGFSLVLEDHLDSGGKVHFSAKGFWDWKREKGDLAADQLWISGYLDDVDYILGRQVISWGTADGFNPTSYFARLDSSALTSGGLGSEPLWAGQATYYRPDWSITAVVVPFFKPQKIDDIMREMMIKSDPQAPLLLAAVDEVKKPSGLGKNSELALRGETNLAGWDLQASFFSGFEPLPGLEVKFDPAAAPLPIKIVGKYRRQNFFGLAAAGTIGDAGVWAEAAYGGPEAFEESENPLESVLAVNKKYVQAVFGGDYTFDLGQGLLVQAQYIYRGQGSLFAPYGEKIEPAHYLYGRLGYDLTPDDSLEMVIIHGLKDQSGLIMPVYTHRFPHSITVEAGLLGVYGKEDQEFGPIPSQARLGLSFKF
ncbi:MAG: hypothetical protein GX335_02250 [Firmicutes bacterium]|nr:hypothetical protein [Bacillota bacterium]